MSNTKQHGQPEEKDNMKLYTVLAIILAIIIAALIMWNNGVFSEKTETNPNAVMVGDVYYDVATLDYYYSLAYNETYYMAQMYAQYGLDYGYDTSLSPSEQTYDASAGTSYHDYFLSEAKSYLQEVAAISLAAETAGYTLSEEGLESVESQLASVENTLLQYTVMYGGSDSYYLTAMYGTNMTMDKMEELLTQSTLATEYATYCYDNFTYDEETIGTYYEENKDELDSYDFRALYIASAPEADVDEDGNTLDSTEEQIADAMAIAKASADTMAAAVKSGTGFNEAAMDYVAETSVEYYADPDYNTYYDTLGSELSSLYSEWLMDESRSAGDVGVVEYTDSGYYVVELIAREKRDNSYQTVDVSYALVTADTTETTDDDGIVSYVSTDAQLADAETAAQALLGDYAAANTDAFTFSEELARSSFSYTSFDAWAFGLDTASVGDTAVMELTDYYGTTTGYYAFVIEGFGLARWEYNTLEALRGADYSLWLTDLLADNIVFDANGLSLVASGMN